MINQILKVMVGLSHLIFPSKGLLNEQSFEPGSMENDKYHFPSFNIGKLKAKLPNKTDITLENFHKFILNSCKSFNRADFLLAVQLGILIYFPGVALSIIYQEYQFEMQQQQQQELEQEFEEQEQDNRQELDPQSLQNRSTIAQFMKQSQSQMQMVGDDTSQLSQQPFTRFVQLLQQMIQQLMQQPQYIYQRQTYYHQYQQDCNYEMQCQYNDQGQGQLQYFQNQQVKQMQQENLIKQVSLNQNIFQQEQAQCIIMKATTRTTKSTPNNENGGVRITLVVNLPGEGGQHQFVQNYKIVINQNQYIMF